VNRHRRRPGVEFSALPEPTKTTQVDLVPIETVMSMDSPRLAAEDVERVWLLAEFEGELILGVRANVTHGLPLSFLDGEAAVGRSRGRTGTARAGRRPSPRVWRGRR
jgi:hypothetical protein